MDAKVKFNDAEQTEAAVVFTTWDFRRLDNGEMLLQFFDEEGRCDAFFPLVNILGVDLNYYE